MKKLRFTPLLFALGLLLAACGGIGEKSAYYGYFTYPNTDWGMTKDEVFAALGKKEADFEHEDQIEERGTDYYSIEQKIFGAPATVSYGFFQIEEIEEPFLNEVYVSYIGESADYDKRLSELEAYLDRKHIPYKKGKESKNDTGGISYFDYVSVATVDELPKELLEKADAAYEKHIRSQESFFSKQFDALSGISVYYAGQSEDESEESKPTLQFVFTNNIALVEKFAEMDK